MEVLLTCRECGHQEWGQAEKEFMNKIKMWNHVRRAHPYLSARDVRLVMKTTFPYQFRSQGFRAA
jgi:hypothetical protein